MEIAKGVGRLFYAISPNETAIKTLEDLPKPDYVTQAVPYFITFIVIEYVVQWLRGKPTARLNDGITSLSHGMFLGCGQLLVRGIESYFYLKIYENYRIYELAWDSAITWYIAALLVDFGYYWLHRAAHEMNFFWAQHQVHHSSEEYNLTTALRQSALQGWIGWIFYLPMAFFVPPSIFLIHQQFNLLVQFWIHTEVVESLGPLEYVLNTSRHHRVHHGSNRYCLDKNYAGWLIIWDRLFGTFEQWRPNEKIVYGLVEEVKSFNPFWLQFFYIPKMWSRAKEYTNMTDKLSVAFKGPGWTPGKPRLGDPMDCPEFPDREKFDIDIPIWQSAYAAIHFFVILLGFDHLSNTHLELSQMIVSLVVFYIIFCLTSIGFVLEGRKLGYVTEFSRTASSLWLIKHLELGGILGEGLTMFFGVSIFLLVVNMLWIQLFGKKTQPKKRASKKQKSK